MLYHVERSKLFVMDRIGKSHLLDAARISRAIEFTRFPVLESDDQDDEEGLLARAANLIGQLGDRCIMNLTKSASTSDSATPPRPS